MQYIRYLLSLLLCLFLFSACGEDDEVETPVSKQIIVLFSPGGLGDRGYNDLILQGLQQVRKERNDVNLLFYSPSKPEEAEVVFADWLKVPSEGNPALFILAGSDYEEMAHRHLKGCETLDVNKQILLFEAKSNEDLPLHTFHISMYGASYMAGYTAALCPGERALVVLGNADDAPIRAASDGFAAGYADGGKEAFVESMADDYHGFAMAKEAYQQMYEWAQRYDFIYPIAGGSNMGIYRYLREYPKGIFTAGMDADQSMLCSQIVGSLEKHIDQLIMLYLGDWLDKGEMPQSAHYGLNSGFVEWTLAPDYEENFAEDLNKIKDIAIKKEKEYEEQ